MRVAERLDDVRIVTAKLSDENKKYVIAVAQALLFTQKEGKNGLEKRQDMVCSNSRIQ